MSDLRNWEKNNGCNGGRQLLARLLKTKKAGSIGACAALLFAAGSGLAAENAGSRSSNNLDSIPVASSSWTSPSGRVIVDLKAKSAAKVGKRAQYPIRQTQALTPAPVASPEFSEPLLGDEDLLPPPDAGETLDPTLDPTLGEPADLVSPSLIDAETSELPSTLSDGAPLEPAAPTQLGTIEEIPTAAPTRLEAPNDVLGPAPTNESAPTAPAPAP
ncbi:MAG: hypothetical protein IJ387_12030, partial [Thermoguttaceae bacterium]|nr:hypothetical protein [Thermoguttaceae bacterium]